jgi:hypothetical protein
MMIPLTSVMRGFQSIIPFGLTLTALKMQEADKRIELADLLGSPDFDHAQ